MMARVYRWPGPRVWRLLDELATIGRLALDAWAGGDRDLLADCARWHELRRAALEAERRRGVR